MKMKPISENKVIINANIEKEDSSVDNSRSYNLKDKKDTKSIPKEIESRIDAIFIGNDYRYIGKMLPLDMYSYLIRIIKNLKPIRADISYYMDDTFDIVKEQISKLIESDDVDLDHPCTSTIRTALLCIFNIKAFNCDMDKYYEDTITDAIDTYLNYVVYKLQRRL